MFTDLTSIPKSGLRVETGVRNKDLALNIKAEEIQSFADNNGMKMFNDALESSRTTVMTDKDVALDRRAKRTVYA